MSTYDIIMLSILVGAVIFGAMKGLAWQIATVSSIVVSYFVSLNFSSSVAEMLQIQAPWNRLVAMLILFLGTSLVIWIIFGRIKSTIEKWNMGGFDRQVGAMVGGITGILLCMITTMFGVSVFGETAAKSICHSRSGGYIVNGIDHVTTVVPDEIHEILKPYVDDFNRNIAHSKHEHENGVPLQSQSFGLRVAEGQEFEVHQQTLQRAPATDTQELESPNFNPRNQDLGLLGDVMDNIQDVKDLNDLERVGKKLLHDEVKEQVDRQLRKYLNDNPPQ